MRLVSWLGGCYGTPSCSRRVRGVQAQLAPKAESDSPLDFPAVRKTENSSVWRRLEHFGQAIGSALVSTTRSYRAPQSSQTYS